jgi:hypothetical protein
MSKELEAALASLATAVTQLAQQQQVQGEQIQTLLTTMSKPAAQSDEDDAQLLERGAHVEVMHLSDEPFVITINSVSQVFQPGPNLVSEAFAQAYADHARDVAAAASYQKWARNPKNLARQLRSMFAAEGIDMETTDA